MYKDLGYNKFLERVNFQPAEQGELDSSALGVGSAVGSSTLTPSQVNNLLPDGSVDLKKTSMAQLVPNEDIQTENYVTGVSGWIIRGDGSVEFSDGVFRGSITATSGRIANWYINTNTLSSGATEAASNVLVDSTNALIRLGATSGDYITLDGSNQRIRSSNYVSGTFGAGFSLDPDLLEVGNIAARGMIRTAVFQKNVISAIAGGQVITPDSSTLSADVASVDTTITINSESTFAEGDNLRIKEGVQDEWMIVADDSAAPVYGVLRDVAGMVKMFDLDSITEDGTWVVSGAGSFGVDSVNYKVSDGSLQYTANGAGTSDNISNSTATPRNLSAYAGASKFYSWFYVSDVTNVTAPALYWGNDSSNRHRQTGTKVGGGAWAVGWNLVEYSWISGYLTDGTPNDAAIDYWVLFSVYTNAAVTANFKFSGLWLLPTPTPPVWTKGATVVNFGQNDDGGIYNTASEPNSPYSDIFTHQGEPWDGLTTVARFGKLDGINDPDFGGALSGYGLYGDNVYLKGVIRALAGGYIGGFDIGSDYVRDAANSMGLASTVTAGDDVRFWAGDTFANRATAPFNVTEAGILNAVAAVITNSIIAQNFTAGHAIVAGNAVYVSDGVLGSKSIASSTGAVNTTNMGTNAREKIAQSVTLFTTTYISNITFKVENQGAATDNVVVALQADSGDAPDGVDIAVTAEVDVQANQVYTFTFSSLQKLTASTKYWFVVRRTGALSDTEYYTVDNEATYASGTSEYLDGGAWSGLTGDLLFVLYEVLPLGYIGKAEADVSGRYQNFIGFAVTSIALDAIGKVSISGIITGLTGLTPGQYYLSDTAGAISTSAGSATRKVGIAISSTQLQITNIW